MPSLSNVPRGQERGEESDLTRETPFGPPVTKFQKFPGPFKLRFLGPDDHGALQQRTHGMKARRRRLAEASINETACPSQVEVPKTAYGSPSSS